MKELTVPKPTKFTCAEDMENVVGMICDPEDTKEAVLLTEFVFYVLFSKEVFQMVLNMMMDSMVNCYYLAKEEDVVWDPGKQLLVFFVLFFSEWCSDILGLEQEKML